MKRFSNPPRKGSQEYIRKCHVLTKLQISMYNQLDNLMNVFYMTSTKLTVVGICIKQKLLPSKSGLADEFSACST